MDHCFHASSRSSRANICFHVQQCDCIERCRCFRFAQRTSERIRAIIIRKLVASIHFPKKCWEQPKWQQAFNYFVLRSVCPFFFVFVLRFHSNRMITKVIDISIFCLAIVAIWWFNTMAQRAEPWLHVLIAVCFIEISSKENKQTYQCIGYRGLWMNAIRCT